MQIIKENIRNETISYSLYKRKITKHKENYLKKDIQNLEEQLNS